MSKSVFIRLFAGLSPDYFDGIPMILLGQWLLPVGIFLLLTGFHAKRSRKAGVLSLYRYGTVLHWWKWHFGKGMACGLWTGIWLLLAALSCDIALGNAAVLSVGLTLKISILWLAHMISAAALFTLLDLFCIRRFALGGLLLLDGLTCIIGYGIPKGSHLMYGMWGMYLQSSLCEAGGFQAEAVIGAEAILLAASFFMGREYLKRETNII